MTVEVQIPFNSYIAAPGATVFTYEFKIVSAADLVATINGGPPLELGVNYSLTGVGGNDGGDLTLFVPLTGGEEVLLKCQMTFERETDYQQNGDFNATVVNNDFDRLWLALRQLGQDLLRSIKVPFTETTDQTIPVSPAARANKALVFDASGNVTASADNYNDQAANAAASALAAQNALNSVNAVAVEVQNDADAAAASAAAAATFNPALYVTKAGGDTFTASPLMPTAAANDNSTKGATTAYADRAGRIKLASVTAVANTPANGVTLTIQPQQIDFRSPTLNNGTPNTRTIAAAISTVISSGSTGGAINAIPARFAILAIDTGTAVEVAWCNANGGIDLDDSNLITTVAEGGGGGADNANVIYSTTARVGVPFKVMGFYDETQAVAGTHSSPITKVQGVGITPGNKSQVGAFPPQSVTRVFGNTYTTGERGVLLNATGAGANAASAKIQLVTSGITVFGSDAGAAASTSVLTWEIPPYTSYVISINSGAFSSLFVTEMKR